MDTVKTPHTVLAIDQSHERTGLAVAKDGELLLVTSLEMVGEDNEQKRRYLANEVRRLIAKHSPDSIIVERARVWHHGKASLHTMAALEALIDEIAAVARPLHTYSAETWRWKKAVLGTEHGTKQDAVDFVASLGWPGIDHDAADAACIALYAFSDAPDLRRECIPFMEQLQMRRAATSG
ncbi:MAG TPA: crossover junction endodeoxyribonuclease RuvC [Ktedonobacterales bacterium]|nr:crossover junction endodeoxyribonuclease RuvC [Ktedonobacterales bacterium]